MDKNKYADQHIHPEGEGRQIHDPKRDWCVARRVILEKDRNAPDQIDPGLRRPMLKPCLCFFGCLKPGFHGDG
jgi:hypothetical protein